MNDEFRLNTANPTSNDTSIQDLSADLRTWDVLVGKIVGRWDHSNLKVQSLDASANRFDAGSRLCLELKGERRLLEVVSSQRQGKTLICDFGVLALEEAEAMRGGTLWVHRAMRPPLPEGEFYLDEVLDFRVQTDTGEELGEITEVLETPAHNVYVTPVAMIPAHPEFILKMDWEKRVVTVRDIPGLRT